MAKKQEQPRRRSLNDRLDAELASAESIPVAGINTENARQHLEQSPVTQPEQVKVVTPAVSQVEGERLFQTKKATTIMPKEVFAALQRYCTETDTPKHRAIYRFLIDGLHANSIITDDDYQRFRDMAALLTTTYEKKQS